MVTLEQEEIIKVLKKHFDKRMDRLEIQIRERLEANIQEYNKIALKEQKKYLEKAQEEAIKKQNQQIEANRQLVVERIEEMNKHLLTDVEITVKRYIEKGELK